MKEEATPAEAKFQIAMDDDAGRYLLMYLPVVEDVGQIMRDGRDKKVPLSSTVCIAWVVEDGMGCGRLQPLLPQIFGWQLMMMQAANC